MSSDLVKQWLQTVLKPYPSRDRILTEVLEVLNTRRTLSVKTDAFTFDSGQTALLILLHGTLPITFRGATYHIPINIWIPLEYPRSAPMAFVVPTKEMGVRKGREVEPGGRVREEVVDEWWRSWQEKTIESLIRQLISVFSQTPPVYARPPEASSSSSAGPSSPIRDQVNRISSPLSYELSSRGMVSSPINGAAPHQPPPPPARPGFIPPVPQISDHLPQYRSEPTPPPSHTFQYQSQAPTNQLPNHYQAAPLHQPQSPVSPQRLTPGPSRQSSQPPDVQPYLPPRPLSHAGSHPPIVQRPMTPPRPAQPTQSLGQAGYVPDPRAIVDSYGPPGPQGSAHHLYPGQSVSQRPAVSQPPPSQYASPPPQLPLPQSYQPVVTTSSQQIRHPQHDLLSSPENTTIALPDPTPPIDPTSPPPLPPSKPPAPSLLHLHSILLPHLSTALPPILHSLQQSHTHLLERREDLLSGEPAIRDEMARLEAVKKVCDSVGRRMEEVVRAGEDRVGELEAKGEVSVDEVVCGISIVHNQLIDLVAEDNAIEDTIYHLTRALDSERIDLDRFLKSIRSLAREQYMKRALIERILQGMGQTQGW